MNEKLQYASMLEIPVNTCNITYKPIKKRKTAKKRVSGEQVKEQLIGKINSSLNEEDQIQNDNAYIQDGELEQLQEEYTKATSQNKPKFKLSVIAVQLAVIGALIATIVITNLFNAQSGLNTFFKEVFSSGETPVASEVDDRVFTDFAPVISMDGLEEQQVDGVMTFTGSDSVYSLDGVVKSLEVTEDGLINMEIAHNDNFVSVFKGLTYAYVEVGDSVFSNIPVGYFKKQLSMCFTSSDGAVISDYEIIDNAVVWAV